MLISVLDEPMALKGSTQRFKCKFFSTVISDLYISHVHRTDAKTCVAVERRLKSFQNLCKSC